MSEPRKLRCAVYTRKSSEEGLDQTFNSLDAQREACVAYIGSQASLGWRLVPDHYDDGGISGGTLERPSIQRLLADIRDGKVDVVVVYKIDRLTRSLMDFAKLVEVFDGHSVSFVSVTQQFNTTTSMGRLTLNVLLSFAQFEREVTAERIRDKVAASKKKGMWMGGRVPLGYRAEDKKLVIDEVNAVQVRHIFQRYLQLRSVAALVQELDAARTPSPANNAETRSRRTVTSQSRGKIYYLLSNPVYIGKVRHKGELHDGEHAAIIDTETFDTVQSMLAKQAASPRGSAVCPDTHLLTGRIYDEHGHRLTPVHAQNHGKRYRYYVTNTRKSGSTNGETWRIAASTIEPVVEAQLIQLLRNRAQFSRWIERFGKTQDLQEQLNNAERLVEFITGDQSGALCKAIVSAVIRRVSVGPEGLLYDVDAGRLVEIISNDMRRGDPKKLHHAICKPARIQANGNLDDPSSTVQITQRIQLKRRGVEMRIVVADGISNPASMDHTLIDMLAKAHLALGALTDTSKRGISDVAQSMQMDGSDLSRILPLAFLSPKLTEAILSGRQPPDLTLRKLTRGIELPIDWVSQDELLAG